MAFSKDVYISESGAGAQDGAACASAHSIAWMNNQANWSQTSDAAKIAWGDTVHLCGTITSAISFDGAGNGGTAYTLLFESGCVVEAGVFTGNGWYYSAGRSSFTIDGGANGIIRCTNSGSPNQGLTSTNGSSSAISLSACGNVMVRNLTISNIYVRSKGPWLQGGTAITMIGGNGANGGLFNVTISNNVISHATAGLLMTYGTNSINILMTGNTISNVNWGAGVGDGNSSDMLSNFVFSYNRVWAFTNWDGTEADALQGARGYFHHNGVYAWAEAGGNAKAISIFGNEFGPYANSQTDGSPQSTAGVFLSGAGMVGPLLVYNNMIQESDDPVDDFTRGIMIWPGTCTARVFNNTIITKAADSWAGIQIYGSGGNLTAIITNNIITNKAGIQLHHWTGGDTAAIDNNIGFALASSGGYSVSVNGSAVTKTLAEWQTLGHDTHGATNQNPLLTSTWSLGSGSPAIGAGVEINSIFTIDKVGVTRGSLWDAGAFEFVLENLGRVVNVSGTVRVGTMTIAPP